MNYRTKLTMMMLAACLAALTVLAACGSSEPEELTFDITIRNDAWNLNGENIDAKQGDTITVNVQSEERGGFHIHGYDLFEVVAPGEPATIDFVADATGRFQIMLHKFTLAMDMKDGMEMDHGDDDMGETEVELGWLRVFPR